LCLQMASSRTAPIPHDPKLPALLHRTHQQPHHRESAIGTISSQAPAHAIHSSSTSTPSCMPRLSHHLPPCSPPCPLLSALCTRSITPLRQRILSRHSTALPLSLQWTRAMDPCSRRMVPHSSLLSCDPRLLSMLHHPCPIRCSFPLPVTSALPATCPFPRA
jgi:hypothetical protein